MASLPGILAASSVKSLSAETSLDSAAVDE